MKRDNKIIIIKLGGSILTDKSKPFSIRDDVIKRAIDEIVESKRKVIIIHGGGSFGHPVAKKYHISQGLDPSMNDQIFGLAKTHEVMTQLNSTIVNKFTEKGVPAISIQPSSIFLQNSRKMSNLHLDVVSTSLDLGMLPILYGDIILDKEGSFSIISGDQIILELCKNLPKYQILKVIFTIEKDGIYVKEKGSNDSIQLARDIDFEELDNLSLAELEKKIDVTGGIKGKLNSIKRICELNIPVQVINGLKEGYIFKALNSQNLDCTYIKPSLEKKETHIIRDRKLEHLKLPIEYDVQHSKNYFKYIKFIHHALPEIDFEEIDLSVNFFGKNISAPICISAITGGHPVSKEINRILAKAAEAEDIIMSVGSQRAALVDPSLKDSFSIVRDVAPNIPIIGNIGIGQISIKDFDIEDFNKCIDMINADIMAIHFNPLHELVQEKGDRSYLYFYKNFKQIRDIFNIPIIAKEVGSGFNQELTKKLDELGFNGFDIGGSGGTSFAAIESLRNKGFNEKYSRNPAIIFREWGIPTPVSIHYSRSVTDKLIIATGGLKTGLDIAKSLSLGANIGGFAYKFLLTAWKDYNEGSIKNTIKEIKTLKNELRSCFWLTNTDNIRTFRDRSDKRIIFGKLAQWIKN